MAESPLHGDGGRRLEGKVVVITGGASGIGEATAHLFASHGPRVIIIADVQNDLGQAVATSIGQHICVYIHCDVTDESQVESMIDHTVKTYGQVDVMFSNAGIFYPDQPVLDLDFLKFDRLMNVNMRGMAICVKYVAKAMVMSCTRGSIICTASVAATVGGVKYTDYTMSKHAVLGLMRSASVQLGKYGIRVNCVSPSAVATPLMCNAFGVDAKSVEDMFSNVFILKGSVFKVKHVAEAVLFLASNESAFVTGHNLAVDGGCVPIM